MRDARGSIQTIECHMVILLAQPVGDKWVRPIEAAARPQRAARMAKTHGARRVLPAGGVRLEAHGESPEQDVEMTRHNVPVDVLVCPLQVCSSWLYLYGVATRKGKHK